MEDKELKKRLKKIPDVDQNGEPIYKIDSVKTNPAKKPAKIDSGKKSGND